jgi:diadenosine tetraphosphate (Ap4A) HIT family hydrolase
MVNKMRDHIISAAGAQRKERYWVGVVAANIVGGIIAQKLGLHDYNMKAIYNWAVNYFSSMRESAESHVLNSAHVLGEFLNESISAYLVVDKLKINPITGSHVVKAVHNKVIARYEMHSKTLFVSKKDFKEYCVSRQMSLDRALRECSSDYNHTGATKKRMTADTGVSSPAVDVYVFTSLTDALEAI